jgi:hypothetical protein
MNNTYLSYIYVYIDVCKKNKILYKLINDKYTY